MTWDGTDWARLRSFDPAGSGAVAGGSGGLLAVVPHLWDSASGGNAVKRSSTLGDAEAGHFMPGAATYMWNGTAFDRIRGDTTNGLDVDVTRTPKSGTATLANVAGSASSVVLRAAAATRLGLTIFNDSTASLYIKFGATASATSFTVFVGPGAYYELPQPVYTGTVDGIWTAAAGNARVTEMT